MKSFRTTKQTMTIMNTVLAHHDHPTADTVYLEVRSIDNHISRGTVYRNLEKLCETSKLLRVKVPGADRFDTRLDYHYHLICTGCEKVIDAPVEYQSKIDELVLENTGYSITRHRTVFEGLCPACAEKARSE